MLREWELKILVKRDSSVPLYMQVVQGIVQKIRAGLLRPGTLLPGSRELAGYLKVNRKTVVLAYDELVAQGWIATEGRRGTFVREDLPMVCDVTAGELTSRATRSVLPSPNYKPYGVAKLLPSLPRKGVIEFTDGVPDTRVIPFPPLSRAFRHALIETARGNQLGYGDPRGLASLRGLIARMLRMERDLNADEDTVCIVRGSQMGIYLAARALVRAGDVVALERLTYPPARDVFRACGASIVSIEQDEDGMNPDSLERACRRHKIRAIYTTPNRQFPTTVTMPSSRRIRLLELAEKFGFVIVEDDYDHEFHYAKSPLMPLASADRNGNVIYVSSLSKVLAPGLRVGYVAAPTSIVNRLANEVMLVDRQGNSVTEHAVAELMESGELKRHIKRALRIYEGRCNLAADLVRQTIGSLVSFSKPIGGLALWLRLDEEIDMYRLEADAEREQVRILSGTQFGDTCEQVHAIRLGFGNLNDQELQEGFNRLRRALLTQAPASRREQKGI